MPTVSYTGGFRNASVVEEFLSTVPQDTQIVYEHEPYTAIQSEESVKAFQTLLQDSRFVIDDLLLARCFYFSTRQLHSLLLEHPLCQKILTRYPSFLQYFEPRYANAPSGTRTGMYQRYFQANSIIERWKKKQQILNYKRLLWIVYPVLTAAVCRWKQRFYAPGQKGYLLANAHFESMKASPFLGAEKRC